LRDVVRLASADGFAKIGDAAIAKKLAEAWAAARGTWDGRPERARVDDGIAAWDDSGRQSRLEIVALLMRIIAQLGPAPKRTAPPPPPASTDPRDAGVETLPGVGPATAAKLRERDLATVEDLAMLLPAGYIDLRTERAIADLREGETVTFIATVRGLRQGFFGGRFSATMELEVEGTPERVVARWFQPIGGLAQYAKDGKVRIIGAARQHNGRWSFVHPQLRDPDAVLAPVATRYPVVEGVPAATVAKLVRAAVARLLESPPPDPLPEAIRIAHGLPLFHEALATLHDPGGEIDDATFDALARGVSLAHQRIAFGELYFVQLALGITRQRYRDAHTAVAVAADAALWARLEAALPFAMTGAQRRVVGELFTAMGEGPPMMRLVQGDVGCGKTAVAFAAALAIAAHGGQSAVMAPTEILAEQHHRTLQPWCERAGLRLALLTGSTKAGVRASLVAITAAGGVDLIVGTHALLTQDVGFDRLGLVVVDEQHRFGVEQRTRLRDKGDRPHLMVMTATPIPRSLALVAYGELDISVIDEMPPGRSPPLTEVHLGPKSLPIARGRVANRVRAGEQAFVVCPLVEASDELDVTDVEATAAAFRRALPDRGVGVVHGRMSSRDKDAVMSAFRSGELAVLVATTVIEVGVDVPGATAILVEHAERFGLSQLHQLRGRVGRGGGASICVLHTPASEGSEIADRLAVLRDHADGFAVAEADLRLRGPGEVFGRRQAGAPRLPIPSGGAEPLQWMLAAREAAAAALAECRDLSAAIAGGPDAPPWVDELRRRRGDGVFVEA
jgi:ATP-dependent DNA helicase RecG